MANYKPAHIFASISTDPPPQKVIKMKETKPLKPTLPTKDNEIQVSATGELTLPPDRCKLSLTVASRKDQVQEAKNSVQRRLDYILQTLTNHQIKEGDIHVTKILQREEGVYSMEAEVVIHFVDFNKCQAISNFLVEKLDETVKVSLPEFYHSTQRTENLRRQASLTAVKNAKQKAAEIAEFLHAKVGLPVAVREEFCDEWEGPSDGSFEPDQQNTVQQRINHSTIHVTAKVSATFQLRSRSKAKD